MPVALSLFLVLFFLLMNAFFVAAEFDIEADFFFALQKFRLQPVNDGLKNVFRNGCRVGQPVVCFDSYGHERQCNASR